MAWSGKDKDKDKVAGRGKPGGTGRPWMRREYLLSALLGLIIVGSLVITLLSVIPRSSAQPDFERRFYCTKCKSEFTLNLKDLSPEQQMRLTPGPYGQAGIDCPKCGAKNSAVVMARCVNPQCKRWYPVPMVSPAQGGPVTLICPYCKVDQAAYVVEHLPK